MQHKGPADFEQAIDATCFGKFNLLLFGVALLTALTCGFESNALSFVGPIAECDLELSLKQKGIMNSMSYLGMVVGSVIWGVFSDNFGRKRSCFLGGALGSICTLLSAFSQNFAFLVTFKFLGGAILIGGLSTLPTYLCEFHSSKYRSKVPLMVGLSYGIASIILPVIGKAILPMPFYLSYFQGRIVLHAWNLFLLICSLPGLLVTVVFYFLPETPKYLMAKGNEKLALEVLQTVFKINTRGHGEYPIGKLLIEEGSMGNKDGGLLKGLLRSWIQIKPLFVNFFSKYLLLSLIMTTTMMNNGTLRAWSPQLFQTINDFDEIISGNNICFILINIYKKGDNNFDNCAVNLDNSSVYINSMIIGSTICLGYSCAALFTNAFDKRRILMVVGLLAGIQTLSLYFAYNGLMVLVLVSLSLMCTGVCVDTTIAVIIDVFPTNIRGSALALILMCGRSGGFLGNVILPYLIQAGCIFPFTILGLILIGSSLLSLLLPNTNLKPLQ